MPTRAEIRDELNFLSDLISTRVRAISGGVLAISWALLIEGAGSEAPLVAATGLTVPIAAAIATLVADIAQYGFGLLLNLRLYGRMRREALESIAYDSGAPLYRLRQLMFPLKLALCALATGWLIAVLFRAVA
jgi:hypothetical protein